MTVTEKVFSKLNTEQRRHATQVWKALEPLVLPATWVPLDDEMVFEPEFQRVSVRYATRVGVAGLLSSDVTGARLDAHPSFDALYGRPLGLVVQFCADVNPEVVILKVSAVRSDLTVSGAAQVLRRLGLKVDDSSTKRRELAALEIQLASAEHEANAKARVAEQAERYATSLRERAAAIRADLTK